MSSIIDSYSESNQSVNRNLNATTTGRAQSFTASANAVLTSIKLYLKKTGSPTGNATIAVYAHSGTYGTSSVPTGSALDSVTLAVSSLTTSYVLTEVALSGGYSLVLGTKYVVVITYTGDASNYITVGTDNTTPTHGGNSAFFAGSWSADNTQDHCFYVYGTLPKTETLVDTFNDNSINATLWTTYTANSGSVTETGGVANEQLASATNGSWAGYVSQSTYDLTSSYVLSQLVAATGGNTYFDLTLNPLQLPLTSNFVAIGVDCGLNKLQAYHKLGGVGTVLADVTYSSSTHKWIRMRESAGTLYYEYSTNGVSWTTLYSEASPLDLSSLYVIIDDYEYNALSVPSAHQMDNLNNPPASPTVTTSAATSVGQTGATGNGNVTSDGNSTITERGVVWSTSANPTTSGNKQTASGTTGAFTAGITGLTASTLYHYRAYAINAVGTSYGADTTFTTAAASAVVVPTVTTQSPTSVLANSAIGQGTITDAGGDSCTSVGFQYSTTPAPDASVSQSGSFGATTFSQTIPSLSSSTVYYVRAFATNSAGTGYGGWVSFTTASSDYSVTIDGVDRTLDILNGTIVIDDILNDQQNTCNFQFINRSGLGAPSNDETVEITLSTGVVIFSGYIFTISSSGTMGSLVTASVSCIDQTYVLDRSLVHKTYEDMTDKEIIENIVATYCAGYGITTTDVISSAVISQISFNYIQPSQALRKIADLTGNNWYIDYDKSLHYFPLTTNPAPYDITDTASEHSQLRITKDSSQIKNRIYVRGGTYLSDFTTYIEVGDGQKRKFPLPDKPHSVTVEVDTGSGYVTKTLGIKNVDTSGFDWYLNFQEKYLEQDAGGAVLTTSHKLKVTYKYDIPILIAQEDSASILSHGVKEFAIFDKSITTTTAARDRALAELTDYANNVVEGSFTTYTSGFRSGQYININSTAHGVNADYIITKVSARSFGAGNYVYDVSIASAKTMGIIRFLIEMLEANKNLIELDNNEVVDELFAVTDSLLSDSITEVLTIDSSGAYFTWCPDSLTASPITRMRWDLAQWG